MWRVAVRPKWIGALIVALAVAGAFAALGQWQLERSIASGEVAERTTEVRVPLSKLTTPGTAVTGVTDGQLVSTSGVFIDEDFVILQDRLHRGDSGWWLVGHLRVDEPVGAGVAVALGWASTEVAATQARDALAAESAPAELTGRYLVGESAQQTDFEAGKLQALAPATLVNLWNEVDPAGVFGGFVASDIPAPGLTVIDAPPPAEDVEINWLNIFYAAEWVIFAGFAVFLWYRLVKDVWEAEEAQRAQLN